VPDLSGLELAAAKSELQQRTLKYKEGTGQYSDTVPEGAVISTNPEPGTEMKRGDTVTVVVSKGKPPITIPDLNGQNINDARNTLQQLGLTAVERYKDSDQPRDQVIGQNPKPGTGAATNAEVTLDVSKGPAQLVVPDLTNQPCPQAQVILQQAGLNSRVNGNPGGVVRFQNPGANTPVGPGTEVGLLCG